MVKVFGVLIGLISLVTAQTTGAGLNKAAKAAGKLYFGTAVDNGDLSTSQYLTVLGNNQDFGQMTPTNALKWDATEPNQNQFTFTAADQIVSLAHQHSYMFRGHNLVWHQQLPGWVTGGRWTNATLTAALKNHITQVVSHYQGQFYAWDVINEPFNDDGSMRSDIFSQIIGEGYIAIALRAARAADPNVKLYINDFNIEGPGAKSTAMQNLVRNLKAQGAPIDGIGFESHFIVNSLPSNIQQNMQAFVGLGVEVAVTELDVRMTLPSTSQLLQQQASNYQTVIKACAAVQKCVGVTLWDFTDRFSWVPGAFAGQGAACPWDQNFNIKPAYNGIIAGFA